MIGLGVPPREYLEICSQAGSARPKVRGFSVLLPRRLPISSMQWGQVRGPGQFESDFGSYISAFLLYSPTIADKPAAREASSTFFYGFTRTSEAKSRPPATTIKAMPTRSVTTYRALVGGGDGSTGARRRWGSRRKTVSFSLL